MSSDDWFRYQGDTDDTITPRVDGVDSLTGVTAVEAVVWRTTAPVDEAVLDAVVLDADACTVLVSLGTWITDAAPGVWKVAVRPTGTWSDGTTGQKTIGTGTITVDRVGV